MKKIIIDCDPGIDDAMALMNAFQSDKLDIMLLSVVGGNMTLEETAKNLFEIKNLFAKLDYPVCLGDDKPIVGESVFATNAQGFTGLGGYQFPCPRMNPLPLKSEDAVFEYLQLNPQRNTTILCLGPLSNIARMIIKYPECKNYISEIVFMAGSKDEDEDSVPYREFNVAFDPEATRIVLESGINLVMVPMELGHIAYFERDDIERIKNQNSIGNVYAKMFEKYDDFHVGKIGAAVHDSCAVFYLTNPELFKTEMANISVKYYEKNNKKYGYIFSDFEPSEFNAKVCVDLDIAKFKNIIFNNIKKYNID